MNIKKEAEKLVQDFDSDPDGFSEYDVERNAESLADFWVESQFARIDIKCDWDEKKSERMCSRMIEELKLLGIPVQRTARKEFLNKAVNKYGYFPGTYRIINTRPTHDCPDTVMFDLILLNDYSGRKVFKKDSAVVKMTKSKNLILELNTPGEGLDFLNRWTTHDNHRFRVEKIA